MAITGTVVNGLDGTHTKIVLITSDNVAADQTQALTFAGAAPAGCLGTAFPAALAPITVSVCDTAANGGALVATNWTVSAIGAAGFTVNRVNGANTSATCRLTFRYIHSIDR